MNDLIVTAPSVITLLGLGGILGGYITFRLNKSKELEFKRREQKEKRYKSALLFMNAYLWPENTKYLNTSVAILEHANAKDVAESLKAEFYDMTLFASKEVIATVNSFINKPSEESFGVALLAMRRDLWSKKKDVLSDDLKVSLHSIGEK
ncbi:MAG: hypothetical protein ACRD4B_09275 [Acidobacteriota bacterium]